MEDHAKEKQIRESRKNRKNSREILIQEVNNIKV